MSDHTRANDQSQEIPYGYCHCGCGQLTSLAKYSHKSRGFIIGQPMRYIQGHYGRVMARRPLSDRFWDYVTPGAFTDCWLWQGGRNRRGYGCIYAGGDKRNGYVTTHRLSWELHYGPIPDDMFVCHRCDNPPCCNPYHLFLGTDADNVADKVLKGRQARGETHASAKLAVADVLEIRQLHSEGLKAADIATMFSVGRDAISSIIRYKTWRHVP